MKIKNKINKKIIENIVSIILLVICVVSVIFKSYNNTIFGLLCLTLNFYLLVKNRKNKLLFLMFIMLAYFNYSVIATRYIGNPTSLLNNLYIQLENYNTTMHIGIISQIVFLIIINFFIDLKIDKDSKIVFFNKKILTDLNEKDKKIIIITLISILIIILLIHLILNIDYNTTIFEYSIFIFIFAFYLSNKNKKYRIVIEIILLLFCIYSILVGERIAVLQLLIVDFIMNYMPKIKLRYIILSIICGIIVFTIAGLYGDFLDYKIDFRDLNINYIFNTFKERKLALDTSVSAYFSGLSMIDVRDKINVLDRLKDFGEYLTRYTLLGASSNYISPEIQVREYQVNYGGGYLYSYFYFWLGWIGVVGISCYVGYILRNINRTRKTDYYNILLILVVSTLPRWYLYIPTFLFRGLLLFNILYIFMYLIIDKKEDIKKLFKNGRKDEE